MNNIIYNSDGINIIDLNYSIDYNKSNKTDNVNHQYKSYKENEIIFDRLIENIIYNSDGFIHNYYYKEIENNNEYKIKIKCHNIQENTSLKETL